MGINKIHKTEKEKQFLIQIGERLGDARRNAKRTQMQAAHYLNCSASHINDVENGNANTTAYELIMLCQLYQISPIQIIGTHEPKYNKFLQLPKDEQQLLTAMFQKLVNSHKSITHD